MTAASGFCFIMAGLCALMLCGIIAAFIFPPEPMPFGRTDGDRENRGAVHSSDLNTFHG